MGGVLLWYELGLLSGLWGSDPIWYAKHSDNVERKLLNFCCNNEQGFVDQTRERADVGKERC